MSVHDYHTEAGLNVSISGINIAEGCAPSGINDAIRQIMADIREESEAQAEAAALNAQAVDAVDERVTSLDSTLRGVIAEQAESARNAAAEADSTLESTLRALISAEAEARDTAIGKAVPAGTVIAFAANAAPEGFLLCNGAAVSRTTYKALFSAIGTTYGAGDGASTFNLPDLADRFIQGSGTAGTVKEAGLPDHKHYVNHTQSYYYSQHGAEAFYTVNINREYGRYIDEGRGNMGNASASNAIYGKSTTVQPPALTMRFYIKY